jgi:hypothetical protein
MANSLLLALLRISLLSTLFDDEPNHGGPAVSGNSLLERQRTGRLPIDGADHLQVADLQQVVLLNGRILPIPEKGSGDRLDDNKVSANEFVAFGA